MGKRDHLPKEAQDFLNYCDATHKRGTVSNYTNNLNKFYSFLKIKYPNEESLFSRIDRAVVQEWVSDLFRSGLKPASRFIGLMNLRCYLTWAFEMGYLTQDSRYLVQVEDFPKRPNYLPRPLELDHDQKLIEYLKNASETVTEKGLLLLRYTGMRVGELLDLPYDCLHQEEDGSSSVKVPLGKLNNERLVPLTDEGLGFIRHMREEAISAKSSWKTEICSSCHHESSIRVEVQPDPKRTYLMISKNGRRLSYSGMRTAMNRACKRAGIPHYSVHQLRHTLATVLLNAGASLVTVMKILGHKKITMTLKYAQIMQQTVRKEYFEAINKSMNDYGIQSPYEPNISDPLQAFSDLIRLIEKKRQESSDPKKENQKLQLIKRLRRIESEIREIF